MKRILAFLLLLLAAPVAAQNPVTVSRVGTVPVTTTVPISGVITANLGTLNGLFLDSTFTGRLPAGASPANGESNTNTALSRIGGYNFVYNGSTWDRWTGAVSGTGTFTIGQATGTNLHMVCDSGCSSSTAPSDQAAFTAGTTSQSPVGGFFQTTATSNPLTTGQMGAFQVTAQRALFTNLRTSAGVETGVAASPLQVSLANTAANGTAVKVDGSAVTQPVSVSGTMTVAGAKTNNNAAPGATNVGALGSIANAAAPSYTEGNLVAGSVDLHGSTRITALDSTGAALTPTTLAQDDTALGTKTSITGSIQMGYAKAAAPADVSADGDAVSAWYLRSGAQVVNLTAAGALIGATSNALDVNIKSGGGSGGTAAADESAFTAGSTSQTPVGGFFQTTATNNALTTGQVGAFQVTANRALFTNLRNSAGTEVATSGAPLRTDPTGSTAQPVTNTGTFATQSAVTAASGSIASGAIASGAVASGAFASGSIASGAIASGAVASGAYGNDSGSFGVGATGSAPPAKASYIAGITSGATGGLLSAGVPVCDQQAFLDMTTATTTEIVALTASRTIHVCHIRAMANGTTTFTMKRGTGSNCGTGTTSIDAAYDLTAQTGFSAGSGFGEVLNGGASANALCVTNSAAVNLHVFVRYAVY